MEKREILKRLDHTLLKQTATWEQIRKLCDEGLKYQTASVCIPPCFVRRAKEYVGDHLAICTVIGFPNGNTTTQAKEAEAKEVLEAGADEIDMVINVGMVKEGDYGAVQQEIETLRKMQSGKSFEGDYRDLSADRGGENETLPGGDRIRSWIISKLPLDLQVEVRHLKTWLY